MELRIEKVDGFASSAANVRKTGITWSPADGLIQLEFVDEFGNQILLSMSEEEAEAHVMDLHRFKE